MDNDQNTAGDKATLGIGERLDRLETWMRDMGGKFAEFQRSLEAVKSSGADPVQAAKVKFVMEKFFPHDSPEPVVARRLDAPVEYEPMRDANGAQVFDQVTGNPVFRPKQPL